MRMCGLTCQNTEIQAHDETLEEGLTAEPPHRVTAQKKRKGRHITEVMTLNFRSLLDRMTRE